MRIGAQKCLIMLDDAKRAQKIYGEPVASLKGKTTRRKPPIVITDLVEVPKEIRDANQNVELSIDVFFINQIPFLISVSDTLKFVTTSYIPNRTTDVMVKTITILSNIYTRSGFTIKTIKFDEEFEPMKASIEDN